ncbi:MAG: sigma-54-dependent Fis family transcriptional regulator [Spirochaetaceae bacterium]|nr:sigma-54-dependent Fis family transcriptional regulator [Myxococcales bacterium]MCB9723598.1 sigma-54-dependent Fis family transcriptional regulator [Spirochaetaceae bacterium]
MASILVVEDEALLARQVARALTSADHTVRVADCLADARDLAKQAAPDLMLLDLRLPDGSGLEFMAEVRQADESVQAILMTAYGSVSDAVDAMRQGATDYIQKPLDLDELQLLVERTLARRSRDRELAYHRGLGRASRHEIIGEDPRLLEIFEQVERLSTAGLAPSQRPAILISGETGTGKGMLARAIHEILGGGPFIAANCTAMPESLIEAELFGHEKGSFTDAKTARSGLFEAADGGTIFLDEIGHASAEMQAKLLKVLEEKQVRRLGSTRDRAVDVHVIAATNRDLDAAVESGEFRRDLLHRLRVLAFEAPPLRERTRDVAALAAHFCEEVSRLYAREIGLSEAALRRLTAYAWPGNVRELRNVIERAVLIERGTQVSGETVARLLEPHGARPIASGEIQLPEGGLNLAELERSLIVQALEATDGNQTKAAKLLGLTRDTLRYRLEKFDIEY